MTRAGPWRGVAVVTLIVATTTVILAPANSSRVAAAPLALGLVAQERIDVRPGTALALTVRAPAALDLTALSTPGSNSAIEVTAYERITTRGAVDDAVGGKPGRSIDSVLIAAADLERPAADQLTFSVAVAAQATTSGLHLPDAGLYPLTVSLVLGGTIVAEVATFVQRDVEASAEPLPELAVALAVGVDATVHLERSGNVAMPKETLAELDQLATILEKSAMPVTVSVAPRLLAATRTADPRLADRFAAVLGTAQVASSPTLPLDPSAAAAAGQRSLYERWLRDGEDLIGTRELPATPVRATSFVTAPLSRAGAQMLRDVGARALLMTPSVYDKLDGSLQIFTDTTQLVHVRLGDSGAFLDGAVIDRRLGALLAAPSTDPVATSIRAVADVLAARAEIVAASGSPVRHTMVLGTDRLGLPDPAVLAPVTKLIAQTPGLQVAVVSDLGARTDTLLLDGQEVSVGLPATTSADIHDRVDTQTQLGKAALDVITMLPQDDPRAATWNDQLSSLASSAVSDADVAADTAALAAEFAGIRAAIVPPASQRFTLTGRSGKLRVRLLNTASSPLNIVVHLDSGGAKFTFPLGDLRTTLAPGITEVDIPLTARSNGESPVFLYLRTPGGTELARVPMTASVWALSGLGNLATGAALLVLGTWWAHHIRTSRRSKRAVAAMSRHPVTNGATDAAETAQPSGWGPAGAGAPDLADTTTTTLPSS